MAQQASAMTRTKSGVSISNGLKVALEQTAISDSGPRFVKVKIEGTELVKAPHSGGLRTADWKRDFNNVKKSLEKDEPCYIVFFAPPKGSEYAVSPRVGSRGSSSQRQVFLGHGHRKGGLSEFVTGVGSPTGSPVASPRGANVKGTAKAWEANSPKAVSPRNSAHSRNRTILMFHCPDSSSAEDKMLYSSSKSALVDILDNPAMYHGTTFKEFEYSSYKKSYDTKGPLTYWERQAMNDDREAQTIIKETPKIGGFLADMHKAGGVMGVKTEGSEDVARELNQKIGSPVASRRSRPMDESKTGDKVANFEKIVNERAKSPARSPKPRSPIVPHKEPIIKPVTPVIRSKSPEPKKRGNTKYTVPSKKAKEPNNTPAPKAAVKSSPASPKKTPKPASSSSPSLIGDAPMSLQEWLDDLGLGGTYFNLMNIGIITLKDMKNISKVRLESAGIDNEKDISKIIRHSRNL